MIPREILKKIRQIELRTNRLVTETLAGFSFHPPLSMISAWPSTYEAEAEEKTSETVIQKIFDELPVP